MSEREYKAGRRLEIRALDLEHSTGANAFHSLIHAALLQASSDNLTVLARMFPKTRQESKMFRNSSMYDSEMDLDLVQVARLMAKVRTLLGQGIQLYEISTEIAGATGGNIDHIHGVLSQHYNEIVLPAE